MDVVSGDVDVVSVGTWWRCTSICTPSTRGGFMETIIVEQLCVEP